MSRGTGPVLHQWLFAEPDGRLRRFRRVDEALRAGDFRNRIQGTDFVFENRGQGWELIEQVVPGALMIRAYLAQELSTARWRPGRVVMIAP